MGDNSRIQWTTATWNPVTGCTKVSPGCEHCYAATLAERFRGTPGHYFEHGFDVQLRPDKLDQPLRWKRPRKVFVNSMSDLFHADVPDEYIAQVFAVMVLAPDHTFQILTKRHGRMKSLLSRPSFPELVTTWAWRIHSGRALRLPRVVSMPLPNVWLGVSVEDQSRADLRIPALMETPAAVRFLSCEPLLGPVTLTHLHSHCPTHDFVGGFCSHCPDRRWPDWVIVGGESGRGARTMNIDWARSLRDQCTASGIPFFFKQWGDASAWKDALGDLWHLRDDGLMDSYETASFPRDHVEKKWGPLALLRKRNAGRELDSVTWDEFPGGVQ